MRRGFTIMELLVVLGIISILALIAVVAINPLDQLSDARDSERNVTANQMEKAMFQYLIDQYELAGSNIQEGAASADPVCMIGYPSGWGCINLDSLVPDFLSTLQQDANEPCINLSGYEVYLDQIGNAKIVSEHYGSGSFTRSSCGKPAGIVGYWKFDEDTVGSTTADASGSGNTATINGAPTVSTSTSTAMTYYNPRSLSFDGSADYLETSNSVLQTATDFSISLWFKADSTSATQHLIWQGPVAENGWGTGTSSSSNEMHISIGKLGVTQDILSFFYGNDDNLTPGAGVTEIQTAFTDTSNWHHLAVVVTAAGTAPSATMYLDGTSVGTDSGTHTNRAAWDTNLRIGRPGPSQRYFDGLMDDVRIYEVALTSGQVSSIYNGTL